MKVVLGFGSNLNDKRQTIEQAINILSHKIGSCLCVSDFMESEPWGFESNNLFVNNAACFQTELLPSEVLRICLETENELGRIRQESEDKIEIKKTYSDRPIDIDLLLIDEMVIHDKNLNIPHPFIQNRDFVLKPLKEIIPNWTHPILKQKIKDIELIENK